MRYILCFTISTITLFAQTPFSFSMGAKIGAPINEPGDRNAFNRTYTQGRWTGGPTIEFHLPKNFSVEFDALFRTSRQTDSFAFQFSPSVNPYDFQQSLSTKHWDFPLLLKYRFKLWNVRPFLSAGHYWSHESTHGDFFYSCSGAQGSCLPADSPFGPPRGGQRSYTAQVRGVVGGAGIEFKTHGISISPEVRYNRPTYGYPRDNRVTGLVGFTFGGKR